MKEIMIKTVKLYWYYEDGVLEALTEAEVKEILTGIVLINMPIVFFSL